MVRISLHRCRLLNKRKEMCGLGRIYTKDFPSPQTPLECIDAYFNENYGEVEDDDDE